MVFAMNQHPRPLTLLRRVSMTTYIIPPTVLYILQHSITGLKYFGQTTQDIRKYKGSGKYWKLHIKKWGPEHVVIRYVSKPYTDSDTISKRALAFSIRHNIVTSDKWANLILENGLDGAVKGHPVSDATKKKTSDTLTGVSHSDAHIRKRVDARRCVPQSDDHIQKRVNALTGGTLIRVECPHCGKIGGVNGMKRYHFDHCKMKPL